MQATTAANRPPPTQLGDDARTEMLPAILLTNARSICNKVLDLNGLLDDEQPDLAFLTETWLTTEKETVVTNMINQQYHVLSANRDGRGGGALILVSKTYAKSCSPICPVVPDLPTWSSQSRRENDEALKIDLKIAKIKAKQLPRGYSTILAVSVYIAEFEDLKRKAAIWQLKQMIEGAITNSNYDNCPLIIIAGDFNKADPGPLCRALNLYQIKSGATHKSGSTLDIILTNAPRCYTCDILPSIAKSDHLVLCAHPSAKKYKNLLPVPKTRLVRSGRIGNTVHALRSADWAPVLSIANNQPQAAADAFQLIVKTAEDTHQPLRPLKTTNDQPWMTQEIKRLIKKRGKLLKAGKLQKYKELANKIVHTIKQRKKLYYRRKFNNNKPDWWRMVNQLRKKQHQVDEDPQLAETLNTGFYGVWSGTVQPDLTAYLELTAVPPSSPIFSRENVEIELKNLNNSSPGPDGISAILLKSARLEISDVLARLFNTYLNTGFVPRNWRDANITPIAKVDHPEIWSDYRPISLTSNLCKTFERVIVKYILKTTSNIWSSNNQHGFLPGRCTMDAVIQVLFDIERAVDQRQPAIAIFFDFAKAFDLVPHDRLLCKMSKILPNWLIKWTASYLSERRQRVRIGETNTEWCRVEAGVIQGSVLGPILFLIYIADINEYLPPGCDTEKYADDIISYITGVDATSQLPQQIVDAVQKWCDDNQMRLNTGKCKVMTFNPSNIDQKPALKLNNTELEIVPNYKYLGIEITTKLDNEKQWDRVCSLTSPNIFLLKQLKRNGIAQPILINIYKSLVLSHYRYSSVVLDSCSTASKTEMQRQQNRMLRIIGLDQHTASNRYGILSISTFIEESRITQVTRILTSTSHKLPATLRRERIEAAGETHATRTHFPFMLPRAKTPKFNNNPVMKTLRHLRDTVFKSRQQTATHTASSNTPRSVQPTVTSKPRIECPTCKRLFIHINKHKSCKSTLLSPAAPS
jgi:hypothetical protein